MDNERDATAPADFSPIERIMYNGGGWSNPPGRIECARQRAAAYMAAMAAGWDWETEPEQFVDISWMTDEEREEEHEVVVLFIRDETGEVRDSLGNIVDADADYLKACAGDLFMEHFPEVRS